MPFDFGTLLNAYDAETECWLARRLRDGAADRLGLEDIHRVSERRMQGNSTREKGHAE